MLILTRKINERIRIGDDVEVVVISVGPNGAVRLGIQAPREVPVHRQEVWEAIAQQNVSAARAPDDPVPALRRPVER